MRRMPIELKLQAKQMQATVVSRSEIAEFSKPTIEHMDHGQLVSIVRAAGLPFLTSTDVARLPKLGRDALLKLGYLAREFCRNQARNNRWSALSE
ncbi:MAG: hypothetical protein AB8G99_22940 [Planctomycetaceae bacterium]